MTEVNNQHTHNIMPQEDMDESNKTVIILQSNQQTLALKTEAVILNILARSLQGLPWSKAVTVQIESFGFQLEQDWQLIWRTVDKHMLAEALRNVAWKWFPPQSQVKSSSLFATCTGTNVATCT